MKFTITCAAVTLALLTTAADGSAQGGERAAAEPRGRAADTGTEIKLAGADGRERTVRVSRKATQDFAGFWRKQPPAKTAKLEKQLDELEKKAARGESVESEVEAMKTEYPEFFVLSAALGSQPVVLADPNSEPVPASCTGIGWIGKNGKLRCIGHMTA